MSVDLAQSDMLTALTLQHMPDAYLNQAAPVQNTWYTILDTTLNAQLAVVPFHVADTGETVEVRCTVDGQVYVASQIAVAGTEYWVVRSSYAGAGCSITSSSSSFGGSSAPFLCRSAKVEIRKTTAAGAGNLVAAVKYFKR
jgi:hypothetical protein